jgi:hypothetical protein
MPPLPRIAKSSSVEDLMGGENLCDGEVVGVVGAEVSVGVDDGVDGLDGRCGGVQLVDERDDVFLVGHRHGAAADAEGPDSGDGAGDVGGGEGLVQIVQIQFVVEEVVESGTDIARPGGQRNAERGLTGDGVGGGHGRVLRLRSSRAEVSVSQAVTHSAMSSAWARACVFWPPTPSTERDRPN